MHSPKKRRQQTIKANAQTKQNKTEHTNENIEFIQDMNRKLNRTVCGAYRVQQVSEMND